jgi:sugar phosphate permease
LAGSVVASLVFGAGSGTLAFFLIAWTMNRASQSVGWGSMVSIVGRWFPAREYGRAMGLASVSYQLGGVIAMLFAGVLLAWGAGWRELFWIPAIVLAGIGLIIRPFIWQSPREAGFPGESAEGGLPASPTALAASQPAEPVPGFVARVALVARNPGFLVMVLLSFVLTLLRECFTLWMPAYFSDLGATASMAAFKSSLFPLLGCAGTLFAGWYSDRVSRGRRGPVLAIFLLGLALSLGGMAFTHDRNLGLGLVGLAGFFLLGPYSMVGGGVVALDLGGPRAAATAAGILDSVGYLAATLAGFGVAQLVTARGWNFAFAVMTGLAAASFVLALVAARMGKVSHDSE